MVRCRFESPWVLLLLGLMPWLWVALGLYYYHNVWWSVLLYAGVCCLVPVLAARHPLALRFSPGRALRLMAVTGALFVLLLGVLQWQMHAVLNPRLLKSTLASMGLVSSLDFWLFAAYFVILNPVIEELFWRGFLYVRLRECWGRFPAQCVTSVLFGGWHWLLIHQFLDDAVHVYATVCVIVGGFVFVMLYEREQNLAHPIIAHALGADLPLMLILYQVLSA